MNIKTKATKKKETFKIDMDSDNNGLRWPLWLLIQTKMPHEFRLKRQDDEDDGADEADEAEKKPAMKLADWRKERL